MVLGKIILKVLLFNKKKVNFYVDFYYNFILWKKVLNYVVLFRNLLFLDVLERLSY